MNFQAISLLMNDPELDTELGEWRRMATELLRGFPEDLQNKMADGDLLEENLQRILRAFDRGTLAAREYERAGYETRIAKLRGALERLRYLAQSAYETDGEPSAPLGRLP